MFTKEEILHYKELDLYSRSLELVTRFFKEKTDKANSNYMNHLLRVSQDFNDINIKSMALMHDVLEDTPITKEDLCILGYSDEFIETLELLSNTYDTYQEYIDHLIHSHNQVAMKIKLKDLLHNMDLTRLDKVTERDKLRTQKYVDAYLKIITSLEGEDL
ncbi:TPA: hypothetical protein IAB95_02605 [Candidatus Ventrenecus avicola]|nr:hypothetical protein [Candidatus Ventrenecus avicola]